MLSVAEPCIFTVQPNVNNELSIAIVIMFKATASIHFVCYDLKNIIMRTLLEAV